MRRALVGLGALLATAVVAGCGSGAKHEETSAATLPVAEQVRQALRNSLQNPALPDMTTAQRPRLPFVAITGCTGPTGGGAGRYECATTPRGGHGIRSITVHVRRDGTWSTQPLRVQARVGGHRTTAVTSVWGVGIVVGS